ncbi:hypothetical protein XarbCFBP8150_21525, partial [Xanthomonas arboricola]|uniref:hypothetical protein n=1 Tax=Xanthomonas arboricola TaxID=56448 RepID=UPI000D485388
AHSKIDYAMNNSFGFGGNNCSLLFGQALGPEADPLDGGSQHQRACPNSSEQLLPPKPKELFIA